MYAVITIQLDKKYPERRLVMHLRSVFGVDELKTEDINL